jgi:hypothetical protein
VSFVQGFPSSQVSGVPAVQAPRRQTSFPLQTVLSGQGVPSVTGLVWQPSTGWQVSLVQAFPSLQVRAGPGVQTPPWQDSAPLQTLLSRQGVPLGTGGARQPATGSQLLVVQGLLSVHVSGVPATQVPPWQVSVPLHTVASAHEVPLGTLVN